MTDDITGTDQPGERLRYVKPFVRNLDASDTEGKWATGVEGHTQDNVQPMGPS